MLVLPIDLQISYAQYLTSTMLNVSSTLP
jgi:hypothetical protein